MAQHQRKHQRRHRRFRFTKLYGVLSALVILAAVIGGCIVFFKVDTIHVEGNERYTADQIVEAAGVRQGDNMYLLNKFKMIDQIKEKLTYVDDVTIRRKLPNTLNIMVDEYTVAAAVQDGSDGQWWLISSDGRLLARADAPGDAIQVTGLTPAAPSEGADLAVGEDQHLQQQALIELLTALEKRDLLANAQSIDLTGGSMAVMQYDNRLTVKMNLSSDFDYNVRALSTVMEDYVQAKWKDGDTGTLDMTLSDGKPHLIKNAAQN